MPCARGGRRAPSDGLMESLELDRVSLGAVAQRQRQHQADSGSQRGSSPSDTVISNSVSSCLSSNDGVGVPTEDDPYAHLTAHQTKVLKRQAETPERTYSFWNLLRYANFADIVIMIVAAICAIASGAAMPVMTIIFGGVQGVFQDYVALQVIDFDEFQRQMARYVLYFVYLAGGTFVATYISTVGFLYTGEHITAKLRQAYLESCLRQNIGFFDKFGAGEVAVKITADANQIQDGISEKIGLLLSSIATLITGFLIGFIISWKLTLIMSSTFAAIFLNTAIWSICIVRHSIPVTIGASKASSLVQEMISSIRVAIAFGSQVRLAKQYDTYLKSSQGHGFKVKIGIGMMMSFIMGLMHLNYGLGFWQGSLFLARGELSLEDAITTLMAVMIGSFNVGAVGPYFACFNEAVATASRLLMVIDRESPIDASKDLGKKPNRVKGHIQLERIRHIYPSRPKVMVMDDVSLSIPAGKTTALVGASGSGKSTIIGLIERFYEPLEGRVLLDGRDITTLNLRWLRQQIGLVGQEPILFSGTIFENIRAGLIGTSYEHSDEKKQRAMAIKAAKNANAHEFVSQLADGYDTKVGQRGALLSGGQKQRIAIARAIICNPTILLLDEATSALDNKSEDIVQAALARVSRGRTTITIAHRLSTIRDAHNIVVMSKGRIVEQGNHEQLLDMHGVYYDLISAQQFTEEVRRPCKGSEIFEDDEDYEKERLMCSLSQTKNLGIFPVERDAPDLKSSSASTDNLPLAPRLAVVNEKGQRIIEKEPKYPLWTLLRFTSRFSKPESLLLVTAFAFCIICGLAAPVQSVFFAKQMVTLSNMGSPYHDDPEVQRESNFWSLMFLMLGCATFLAHAIQSVAFGYAAEAMLRRVRHMSLKYMLRQDVSFFDMEKNSPGALTAFLAVETMQLVNLFGTTLGNLIISITSIIASVALSVAIGWKLALVCLSVVPLLIVCGFLRFFVLQKYANRSARAYAESAAYAAENISAMRTVVSLTLEEQVAAKYRNEVNLQRRQGFTSVAKSGALFAASQSVLFLCLGLGFWYGSTLMATFQYGLFQFFVCLMSIIFGAQSAGSLLSFIPDAVRAKYAAAQLKVIFDRKPAIDIWDEGGKGLEHAEGRLDFLNVHFRYPTRPEKPVLRGLDLTIQPGQHVALVGSSGCGKSTIIGLLERFYDPFIGQVLIDGIDITEIHVNHYRSHIALVSQEPALFCGTIRDNICMGTNSEEVSDEQIETACRDANIYEFIMSLPDGFGTDIGSAGTLLSGGQKQRIAIARAMIRRPKVLLLDEATSALDSESERVVQTALDRAARGRTTVTIAHRLTTVQNADCIHVIDQGRVAESGTHHQLMALNGRYAELVKLQSFS